MALTYEPIATTTLGSATTTVTFSSIPSTYTDIRLVCVVTITSLTTDARIRFNNDSGTNYFFNAMAGDGPNGAYASSDVTQTGFYLNKNTINQVPHFYTCDIFSYAGSTFKTTLQTMSENDGASGPTAQQAGVWKSTAAINRVDVVSTTARTFAVGSTFTLYGIKAA
jgi:hypothetical protein